MTLTLLNINNQHQIIVSIIFNNITKEFRVITESSNDEQTTAFNCTPGWSQYSFIEVLFKNTFQEPWRVILDNNFFLRHKRRKIIIKTLTYNIITKSYNVDTIELETWEKATLFVLQNLQTLHFSKVSSRILLQQKLWYQTIWIIDSSLNEPNRNCVKSTW